MKISEIDFKKARILHDYVAFKWIKLDKFKTKGLDSGIIIPETIHDRGGEGRLGHRYTCEVLGVGPKVQGIKPGDRFLLHEYDKVDQGDPWKEDHVMFCESKVIPCLLPDDTEAFVIAKQITDKMMDEYEDY